MNARDKDGETPLHSAAKSFGAGTNEHIKALIAAGADVSAKERVFGSTPLHYAANSRRADRVRILLNAGANPNARDNYSYNPLRGARKEVKESPQWPEIANLLKAAGSETKPNASSIGCRASRELLLGNLGCIDNY